MKRLDVILMHKDNPLTRLHFDENGSLLKIREIYNEKELPLPAKKDKSLLKEWLTDRAVPKTRHGVKQLLKNLNIY